MTHIPQDTKSITLFSQVHPVSPQPPDVGLATENKKGSSMLLQLRCRQNTVQEEILWLHAQSSALRWGPRHKFQHGLSK